MYTAIVFYLGPKTKWSGKVADDEIIARSEHKYRVLARLTCESILSNLNTKRCGYAVIDKTGKTIKVVQP